MGTTPKTERTRIDYMPGPAALEALQVAQEMFNGDNTQALIDRLLIVGLDALVKGQWTAPMLSGRREGWKLPKGLLPREKRD